MQHVAPRCVKAERKRGVQAEGLRACNRKKSYLSNLPSKPPRPLHCVLGLLSYLRPPQILPALMVHDKHIFRPHELFLHTRGREVYVLSMFDGQAAAGAGDPAVGVELAAEGGDVICGMGGVGGGDEGVVVVVGGL